MIDYEMRKLMKREKHGRLLSVLLLLQCVIYTFVTLRIVLLGTIALTSLFYCNIKKTCKKLLIAYIYCAVVFVVCSIYNQELEPLKFLGLKDRPDEIHKDVFFHERNTLYFAMLPNDHLKLKIDTFIEAFESKKFVNIKSDDLLTYILNLDYKKAYENMCIYHRGNTLVYVNGKVMPYEDTERNFYKSTVDELTKKQAVLNQMGIESERAILFSVYIPEYDSFWTDYKQFCDKEDMARYIVKNLGYLDSLENANYEYILFSNNGECNVTYKQKNIFKMIVIK